MTFFVERFKPVFQYDNEEDDLSSCSNEGWKDDEEEIPVEELL